jgi:FOG: PKD repeat
VKNSPKKVKNIVITEKTYKALSNHTLNKKKLAKISDSKSGKPWVADDPNTRKVYEFNRLKNPITGLIPANIKTLERAYVLSSGSGLQSKLKAGGLSYTQSGPRNVGGRTRALAIDVASENTILSGGVSGGLWKSTNKGQSWYRVTDLEAHPSITAIAQDPRQGNTNIWYYTTGEGTGNSASGSGAFYYGNGLFKSTDNGETWNPIASTASNTLSSFDNVFDICWNICVDPTNGDVYVATYGRILVSKDGGDTWNIEITSNDSGAENPKYSYYTDVICTPDGVKYATLSSGGDKNTGIWRKAAESDAIWVNITDSGFPSDYARLVIAHAPSNTTKEIVYLLGRTSGSGKDGHSFWKLTYNSANDYTWIDRSSNLPSSGSGDSDVSGYNSQSSYNMTIAVAPDDENMVFIGGTNLFRSDDAFATSADPINKGGSGETTKTYWIGGYATENNVTQYDDHHPDIHSLAFINNSTLVCGHDGGLSITTNYKQTLDSKAGDDDKPVDWEFLNNGYLTTQAYTVSIDHDITTNKALLAGFQDNGTWLASNALPTTNWQPWLSGDGSFCSIFDKTRHYLSSFQNGGVYLESNDAIVDSYYYTRVDPADKIDPLFINPFIVDANNSEIMYYADQGYLWRNSNIFGIPKGSNESTSVNWDKLEISQTTGKVSALESSTFPAHVLYYGTSTGKIYKIENSHSKWAKRTDITADNMPEGFVSSIDSNPLNADELIACFSNYEVESIFYSKDGGANWTAISGNLEDESDSGNGPSVKSVAIMVSPTDTTYYAGTSTGLYSTSKLNGNSTVWTQESLSKIGTSVVDMIKARRDGFIAIGTHGNGIFTSDADYSTQKPVALIGLTADTIQIGESVNFLDRSIGDGISTYTWTFHGAETTTSNDQHPENIVYNTPGTHKVSLEVTNAQGSHIQTIEKAIVVSSVEAKFAASATDVDLGTSITFTDQSSGTPTSWTWSFPGGNPDSSNEQNPVITYNTVGTYDVSLTVSDGTFTSTETKTAHIKVVDKGDFDDKLLYNGPENDEDLVQSIFTSNKSYVTGHNEVELNNGSTTNITQYAEKFNIGNENLNAVKQVQINPSVAQNNSGNPVIILKIWNGTNSPTDLVYEKEVSTKEFSTSEFNVIDLDSPVVVDQEFFVGYELKYENPVDTFAVFHLPLSDPNVQPNTAYLYLLEEWLAYSSDNAFQQSTSLAIKALAVYDPGATGIDDALTGKKTEKLLIYPNPMIDKSKVEFPNEKNQQYRLIVVDASGRVVRIIENITNNNVIINREQLKPGLHIINLSGEKNL